MIDTTKIIVGLMFITLAGLLGWFGRASQEYTPLPTPLPTPIPVPVPNNPPLPAPTPVPVNPVVVP